MAHHRRRHQAAIALTALLIGLSGCGSIQTADPAASEGVSLPTASQEEDHPRLRVHAALDNVSVLPDRPQIPGYSRAEFGPAWTDNNSASSGNNDCDTRNDTLAQQLDNIITAYDGCTILEGIYTDPYTGQTQRFSKSTASNSPVDHVYSLSAAWDHGAWAWTPETRVSFANDTNTQLVVTTQRANIQKSDHTPSEWLPAHNPCQYVADYLTVAVRYELTISADDKAAITTVCRSPRN